MLQDAKKTETPQNQLWKQSGVTGSFISSSNNHKTPLKMSVNK